MLGVFHHMFRFVVGAATGYFFGTKAGRKRYHQIKDAYQKTVNSPVTHGAIRATRRAVANRLDPEPRMREVRDLKGSRRHQMGRGRDDSPTPDRIYEPDED
ncbi:hypothetical protein CMASS_07555 [Corynebacterium massiliense DSM 45435]|uniref:YtxH domain-containing protein n=2 Tax=Corynebacterium massiliense TaxID=441501 RepID=A0ABY7U8F0_9CORY|nr:hypothetical protein CMASS_07555 [Corynebacterium massiliense DSM 45435]